MYCYFCSYFIINSKEQYIKGEKICIDKISASYNFIGIMDDEDALSLPASNDNNKAGVVNIKACDNNIKLYGIKNSSYRSEYIQTCYVQEEERAKGTPASVMLYKEFQGNITCPNRKVHIFKYGLRFFADNLKVKISGKIGKNKFTAEKDYRKYNKDSMGEYVNINPVEITKEDTLGVCNYKNYKASYSYKNCRITNPEAGLNFTPINIYEDITYPKDKSKVKIKLKLDGCLSADRVIFLKEYKGNNKIRALIEYNFLIKSNIYFMDKENIAVFVKEKTCNLKTDN